MHKALFSIADYIRGDRSLSKLKELKLSQYWKGEELIAWQLKKINDILYHAKNNSEFYGNRLGKIRLPLDDLKRLEDVPVLTKKDIRDNMAQIMCCNIARNRFVASNTGGSTGEPMQYYCDRASLGWKRAAVIRCSEWAGIRFGEMNIQMTGSHYEYTARKTVVNRIKLWLLNGRSMPVAYVNDDIWMEYLKAVVRHRPASIWGYASAVHQFAEFIKKSRIKTDFDFIKAIITSSETLQPYHREVINNVFGDNKVFDHYGSSEFYAAAECGYHNGYHINEDIFKLEVVDSAGKQRRTGETGRIILTDFYNYAFPFIRYEIGDVGALEEPTPCKCGITLPKLTKIEGRIADLIVLCDRVLTPPNFTNIFRPLKGVSEYQIVQNTISSIDVNIVRNDGYDKPSEDHVRGSLEKILGKSGIFNINYVERIEVPKSGKRRYVVSKVAGEKL